MIIAFLCAVARAIARPKKQAHILAVAHTLAVAHAPVAADAELSRTLVAVERKIDALTAREAKQAAA